MNGNRPASWESLEHIEDPIIIGQVCGFFGTHGWLKVLSYSRPRQQLFEYPQWWLGRPNHWQPFVVSAHKVQGKALLATLEGIADREHALGLMRHSIAVPRSALSPAGNDEYYWADIIGCTVNNVDGTRLGVVKRLYDSSSHDTLVVRGEREYLIPFVRKVYIVQVDVQGKRLVVDWHPDD